MSRCHWIQNEIEDGGQKDKDALGRRDWQIIISLLNSWSVSIITEGECFPRAFTLFHGIGLIECDVTGEKQQVGLTFLTFTGTSSNNSGHRITSFQAVFVLIVLFFGPLEQ